MGKSKSPITNHNSTFNTSKGASEIQYNSSYFIQTNSCTLFQTHSHSNLKHTTKHPIDKYIRHAHTQITYSHIPNKQLDDANKQRSSNSTKHERRPPEDGRTIVTETCMYLMMGLQTFLTIQCFKCECECVLKRVHELV